QHVKVLKQDTALVFERRLKYFAAVHSVLDLAKDPGVGHRAAANQHAVAAGLTKASERAFNGRHIAAARHGHFHYFFYLPHQVPVGKTTITLFLRASMQRDVLSAASLSQFRGLDGVDRVVVIAGANLDSERDRDRLFYFLENGLESRIILQQPRSTAV